MSTKPLNKTRYDRQIRLDAIGLAGQQRLADARVLCIGAGGLAHPALAYLVAAGVGFVCVYDGDQVAESNLPRQTLYTQAHIGQDKVSCLVDALRAINPGVTVVPVADYFWPQQSLSARDEYDLILDCSDDFATKYALNALAREQGVPLITASLQGLAGQLALLSGATGPCYACLFPPDLRLMAQQRCEEAGVMNTVPGALGMLQAQLALSVLLGQAGDLYGQLWTWDAAQMQMHAYEITVDPACSVCREDEPATDGVLPSVQLPFSKWPVAEITWAELTTRAVYRVDVRTEEERARGHLGGVHIPLLTVPDALESLAAAAQRQPVLFYCQSGQRSRQAARLAQQAGIKDVLSLTGGLAAAPAAEVIASSE